MGAVSVDRRNAAIWLLGGFGVLLWAMLGMLFGGSPASAAEVPVGHPSASAHATAHKTPPGNQKAHQSTHQKDRGAPSQPEKHAQPAQRAAQHAQQTAPNHAQTNRTQTNHSQPNHAQQATPQAKKAAQRAAHTVTDAPRQHSAQRAPRAAEKAQQKAHQTAHQFAPFASPATAASQKALRGNAHGLHARSGASAAQPAFHVHHGDHAHRRHGDELHSRHGERHRSWHGERVSASDHVSASHRHRSSVSAPAPTHTASPTAVTDPVQAASEQEPTDTDAGTMPFTPLPEHASSSEPWTATSSQSAGGSAPSVAMDVASATDSTDPGGVLLGIRAPLDDELPSSPASAAECFPD